jgi:pectate lyase
MKTISFYKKVVNLSTLLALSFSASSYAVDLNVVSLTKLSETRIDRTNYDYVFAVTVQNGSQAITGAEETLTASGVGTSIIDGNVVIGDLAAGEQVTPSDTIKIRHNRSLPFDASAFVWTASGTAVASSSSSSAANFQLLSEHFDVDKATLFSADYRSISTDSSAALFYITGGSSGLSITNNELTLAGARFTIGHKPPRTNTLSSDSSANGDFDLSRPYRISFRVVASSGSGALQVMVDNNGTSAGNSLHGSASRVFNAPANSLIAGETIVITPSIGTTTSFISLRTESSASVTIDDLVIEYLDDVAPPASSSAASTPASSIATSSTPASVPASSSAPASSAPASSAIAISSAPASSSSAATSSTPSSYDGAIRTAKMEGFAAYAGVTGGQGGAVVTVTTGTELNAALCNRATMTTPIIIMVNGTINHGNTTAQGCNTQGDLIEIKQTSNVSIIGVGTNALFDELGIHVRDASNIIIQNVHIRNVKKSGSPTSNGGDAIGMETRVDRVWIDHNWLEASGGEKDGYDSLLDMKAGVTNVTVSYNLYNDSSRAGLIGSSDSDDKNTNITFHHNWYKNIEQRTPLIRHALVHVYNNYWSNESIDYMFHAINSRSDAKALVESNYFYNVNNPLIASSDSPTPGCWQTNNDNTVLPYIYYSRTVGNGALVVPEVIDGQLQSTCAVSVPYLVDMDAANDVPAIVMANAGVGKISTGGDSSSSSSVASSAVASSLVASSAALSSMANSSAVVVTSSEAASSVASSEAGSSNSSTANSPLINEAFNVDKATLFSADYQSISTDASAALYYITGGGSGISIADNELTLAGARLTIGHRPPRTSTTSSDISANGDFDLSRAYHIRFKVVAASGSGKVQVYIDNSTTSSGNSLHGSNSKVFEAVASSLSAGQIIDITPSVGTANSFIALRTESSATLVIDDLVVEYLGGAVSSSVASSTATASTPASSSANSSAPASSVASSITAMSSSSASSLMGTGSSSVGSSPSVAISEDCYQLATNPNVNWRDGSLQTDQEIVECLSQTLGKAVGYGENALGGYDPNGNSHLVVIRKNTGILPEQQVLDAISSEAHNWIVFDKNDYASGGDLAMYRLYCSNAGVLAALDNATQAECLDHNLWCTNHGVSSASCAATFFNDRLNDKNLIIRNELVKSNTTLDGRGSNARFLFNGFKIGADDSGVSTYQAQNVIMTHLFFEGAGHAEDHYLDPDMIRSTGESHDIWIHKNTFKDTGDSAFDVKVGAYGITMSYNRLIDVLRASLHGSSDSRTINSQIRTTMHNNFFATSDAFYNGPHAADNTARRVPLLRRGSAHMFNNVFYNYRKNFGSVRVGGTLFMESNVFLGGPVIQNEKSSLAASYSEWLTYLTKDDFGGGYFGSTDGLVTFADTSCRIDNSYQGFLPAVIGSSPRDLKTEYSQASRDTISNQGFSAGQDLVDYTNATAGKYGEEPFNSPLAKPRASIISAGQAGCL